MRKIKTIKCVIAIFCLLLSRNLYAQQQNISIKLAPLAAADFFNFPTLQGGIEIRLSKHVSWYNEFGIKIEKGIYQRADTTFLPSRGYKLKSELRYYFQQVNNQDLNGAYFAINGFFNHDTHNSEISYRSMGDSTHNKTDDFGVNKNVIGGNILCGWQLNFSNHFGFDVYGGIGGRVRNIHTVGESYNKNVDFYNRSIDINIPDIILQNEANAGISSAFNLTAGIRIYYIF